MCACVCVSGVGGGGEGSGVGVTSPIGALRDGASLWQRKRETCSSSRTRPSGGANRISIRD